MLLIACSVLDDAHAATPPEIVPIGPMHAADRGTSASDVTPGGEVAVGSGSRNDCTDFCIPLPFPIRWTPLSGPEKLPFDNADAGSVSADGGVIVGAARVGGVIGSYRWRMGEIASSPA